HHRRRGEHPLLPVAGGLRGRAAVSVPGLLTTPPARGTPRAGLLPRAARLLGCAPVRVALECRSGRGGSATRPDAHRQDDGAGFVAGIGPRRLDLHPPATGLDRDRACYTHRVLARGYRTATATSHTSTNTPTPATNAASHGWPRRAWPSGSDSNFRSHQSQTHACDITST